MDPNATLREIRELTAWLRDPPNPVHPCDWETKTDRLAELVAALDEWLSRGGFLPKAWEKTPGCTCKHPDAWCPIHDCCACGKHATLRARPRISDPSETCNYCDACYDVED